MALPTMALPTTALLLFPMASPRRSAGERVLCAGDDYFSFWVGGVKYVSINQYYHILCVDNPEADEMAREQEAWVEEELSAARRRARCTSSSSRTSRPSWG